ncbi:VOC family protein [Enterovibrio sp. ZSDZ35]|uniref:Aldoketomutase n=1 Tax=Enterovibrio qingdaonensis TaxID=2899818 RepID=A0ABT5QF23_9GAMM|nr:VOC family protein [Enterovibrio sp. ZSDZ35]MDD1779589.1 VOC family protein [Enterovibrio sp. ZSDZ35]
MAKAIHSMIRVLDPDISIQFYHSVLGLDVEERFDFDGFSLIYLRNQETSFEIELTHNHNNTEPYTHGTGYGHLAVSVADIASIHASLVEKGLSPTDVKTMNYLGNPMATFFFITDPDGYKIEFLERTGRFASM